MFVALLVSCLLPCVPVREPEQQPELVTTLYDLRDVWPSLQGEQQGVRLVPLEFSTEGVDESLWEADDGGDADQLMSLLVNVVAPEEFQYEGRFVDTLPDGRLRVRAPAEVQASVARAIDLLKQAMHRRALVDIDLWRATGELDLSGPLTTAAVDAARAAGALQALASRHEELLLGRTERREALTVRTYVRDWDVEIAQSAAIEMPQMERLRVGTRLLLRLQQDTGSERYVLRFVEQLSELRALDERSDPVRSLVTVDGSYLSQVVGGHIDQPAVAFATLAGSQRLGPGEEFFAVTRTRTLDGPVAYVARYRLRSVDPAPAPLMLVGSEGAPEREVLVRDISPFVWPALSYPLVRPDQLFPSFPDGSGLELLRFPSEERGDADAALEMALPSDGRELPARSMWGAWWIAGGEADLVRATDATLDSLSPPRRNLQLDVVLQDSGRDGAVRELARASLPLRAGETGLLVSGCARLLLAGYEVDVANSTAVPDPYVQGCLDGLSLRAVAGGAGDVALDVLSHRALRRDREDLGVSLMGPIDRVELAIAQLHPHLQPDGAWHEFQDVGNALNGDDALLLRCRLSAP